MRRSADYLVMRPLIGVFTSERHAGQLATLQRCDEGPARELRLGMPYLRAIELGGGIPVVLAPETPELAEAMLDRLDGLCLAGGPDLDPLAYGAGERHALLGPTDRTVDTAELALARGADARRLPLLGICRGLQALNVARGGTLHQHVDAHRQTAPATEPVHALQLVAGSLLARLTGAAVLEVNSFHHQAACALGAGLAVGATAADGTVEALEDRSRPFFLGVQWHAEGMVERPEQLALFAALAEAAATPRLALVA
jgi:putative glutamine amidotransferase